MLELLYRQFLPSDLRIASTMQKVFREFINFHYNNGINDENEGIAIFRDSVLKEQTFTSIAHQIKNTIDKLNAMAKRNNMEQSMEQNAFLQSIEFMDIESDEGNTIRINITPNGKEINDMKAGFNQLLSMGDEGKLLVQLLLQYEFKFSKFANRFGSLKQFITTKIKKTFNMNDFYDKKVNQTITEDEVTSFIEQNYLERVAVQVDKLDQRPIDSFYKEPRIFVYTVDEQNKRTYYKLDRVNNSYEEIQVRDENDAWMEGEFSESYNDDDVEGIAFTSNQNRQVEVYDNPVDGLEGDDTINNDNICKF